MKPYLSRSLGFALTTVTLVTALHLAREASDGEALDGVVSGGWFALVFLATSLVRSRVEPGPVGTGSPGHLTFGVLLAGITWALLWLCWSLPMAAPLRESAFLVNSMAMAAAACSPPFARHDGMEQELRAGISGS